MGEVQRRIGTKEELPTFNCHAVVLHLLSARESLVPTSFLAGCKGNKN